MKFGLDLLEKNKTLILLSAVLVLFVYFVYHVYTKFPIHPDEINTRITNSRFIVDAYKYLNYQRPCNVNPIEVPYALVPAAVFWSLYTSISDFYYYRVIPFFCFVTFLFILATTSNYSSFPLGKNRFLLFTALLAASYIPSSSIWNSTARPESLFFIVLGSTLLSFYSVEIKKSRIYAVIALVLFYLSSYLHPKILYFTPLLFFVTYIKFTKPYSTAIIGAASIIIYIQSSFSYPKLLSCPTNPVFQEWFVSMNINPLGVVSDPAKYFEQMKDIFNHLIGTMSRGIRNLSYIENPDIGYLPATNEENPLVKITNNGIRFIFYALCTLFFVSTILLISNFRDRFDRNERIFLLAFGSGLLVNYVHNRTLNTYDLQYWYILLLSFTSLTLLRFANAKVFNTIVGFIVITFVYANATYLTYVHSVVLTSWNKTLFSGPSMPIRIIREDGFGQNVLHNFKSFVPDYDTKDLILVDDRTYHPLKHFPNIAPITYTMQAIYYSRTPQEKEQRMGEFISTQTGLIFVGSCDFLGELTSHFHNGGSRDQMGICYIRVK